jgi:predicted dehydrogenase
MNPLRLAMVGCGGIAATHIKHFSAFADFSLTACIDNDLEKAKAFAAQWGPQAIVGTTLDEALALRPDVVDLCTPPHLHAPWAIRVMEAGCNVIVEKPLAGSLADFDLLLETQEKTGKIAIPVLQNRLGTGPCRLRTLVQAGLTGPLLHATGETMWRRTAEYYAAPWRGRFATELGGTMTGLMVHQLDLLMSFAAPVTAVMGHAATLVHPIEVEDTGAIVCSLSGGGWISTSVSAHAHRQFSRGVLIFEHAQAEFGDEPYSYAHTPWRISFSDSARERQAKKILDSFTETATPPNLDQLWWRQAKLTRDILRGEPHPASSLASARPSMEVLSAAYASIRTGQRISLPITPEQQQYRRLAP